MKQIVARHEAHEAPTANFCLGPSEIRAFSTCCCCTFSSHQMPKGRNERSFRFELTPNDLGATSGASPPSSNNRRNKTKNKSGAGALRLRSDDDGGDWEALDIASICELVPTMQPSSIKSLMQRERNRGASVQEAIDMLLSSAMPSSSPQQPEASTSTAPLAIAESTEPPPIAELPDEVLFTILKQLGFAQVGRLGLVSRDCNVATNRWLQNGVPTFPTVPHLRISNHMRKWSTHRILGLVRACSGMEALTVDCAPPNNKGGGGGTSRPWTPSAPLQIGDRLVSVSPSFHVSEYGARLLEGSMSPGSRGFHAFDGLFERLQRNRKLKGLTLKDATYLEDKHLHRLPTLCPQLTSLHLIDCPGLHDSAVLAMANRLPSLTDLSLARNNQLSSKVLQAIANSVRTLKKFDVSYSGGGKFVPTFTCDKALTEQLAAMELSGGPPATTRAASHPGPSTPQPPVPRAQLSAPAASSSSSTTQDAAPVDVADPTPTLTPREMAARAAERRAAAASAPQEEVAAAAPAVEEDAEAKAAREYAAAEERDRAKAQEMAKERAAERAAAKKAAEVEAAIAVEARERAESMTRIIVQGSVFQEVMEGVLGEGAPALIEEDLEAINALKEGIAKSWAGKMKNAIAAREAAAKEWVPPTLEDLEDIWRHAHTKFFGSDEGNPFCHVANFGLEELSLSGGGKPPKGEAINICLGEANFPNLLSLTVASCESLYVLQCSLPRLTKLCATGATKLTGVILDCPNLIELNLSNAKKMNPLLARGSTQLEVCKLFGCREIGAKSLRELLKTASKSLRHLDINGAYGTEDVTDEEVCKLCPNLEHLDAKGRRSKF